MYVKKDKTVIRSWFDTVPGALLIIDLEEGIVMDANKRSEELLGLSVDEIRGLSLPALFADPETIEEHFHKLLTEGTAEAALLTLSIPSGNEVRVAVSCNLFEHDGKQTVHCLLTQLPDLTEEPAPGFTAGDFNGDGITRLSKMMNIETEKIRSIDVYYSGFVMAAALRDLLKNQKVGVKYRGYPNDLQEDLPKLQRSDFVIIAVPRVSDSEVGDIKELCRLHRNLPLLVISLNAGNRQVIALMKAGVRGVITNENEFHLLPAAINAINNSELWCPRSILQQVFENYRLSFGTGEPSNQLLSDRELEILRLIVKGFKNKEIAEKLGISYSTVINHTYNIYRKLEVNNRAGAIRYAINNRLVAIV